MCSPLWSAPLLHTPYLQCKGKTAKPQCAQSPQDPGTQTDTEQNYRNNSSSTTTNNNSSNSSSISNNSNNNRNNNRRRTPNTKGNAPTMLCRAVSGIST